MKDLFICYTYKKDGEVYQDNDVLDSKIRFKTHEDILEIQRVIEKRLNAKWVLITNFRRME